MWAWLLELDRVLRGDATRAVALQSGAPEVSAGRLAAVGVLLGAFYGFCMGFFGVFNRPEPEYRLLVNGMIKVPALFGLTLIVTFRSLLCVQRTRRFALNDLGPGATHDGRLVRDIGRARVIRPNSSRSSR